MSVYWSSCIVSITLTYFVTHITCKNKKIIYWLFVTLISASPFIFIAAIRYNVGADYFSYYQYYVDILNGSTEQGRFEYLYYFLNKIVAFGGSDPVIFFGVCAIVFLVPIYLRIVIDSPYPAMSIFLLIGMTYYFFFLNGARQMLGAAILMLALPFAWKRKIIPFSILTLVATGFHTLSFVFFAVYPLMKVRLSLKHIVIVTVIIIIFSQVIGSFGNSLLGRFEHYSGYLNSIYADRTQGQITLAINFILVLFSGWLYQEKNDVFKAYYLMQILAFWCVLLTGKIVMIERVAITFGLFSIILVPMTLKKITDAKIRWLIGIVIVLLYFVYATYTVGISNANTVVPYQDVFDYSI